ncbi:uncharacterized protein LOC125207410 [Salvia hispanica]|uniref:uncharacterized protein LOC125207410 n=1 Tax=Salvia hispanica TaxID=49212 RepID=UPI0020091535|nr:uncharacterized protein LOC125207410 [Salvia hispanica]
MYTCNVVMSHLIIDAKVVQSHFYLVNNSSLSSNFTPPKKMSSKTELINQKSLSQRRPSSTSFRWSLRTRARLPTIRLGGKKPRRGFFLLRLCKKAKLKWLKLKYLSMLKKLKRYYNELVKDMIEGSGTIESFQQRMLLETSFAIPVMGLSLNSYPSSNQHW